MYNILHLILYIVILAMLVRTFMFLGFSPLPPASELLPVKVNSDVMYMAYTPQTDESCSDDDDADDAPCD